MELFEILKIPILGIVENMSYYGSSTQNRLKNLKIIILNISKSRF